MQLIHVGNRKNVCRGAILNAKYFKCMPMPWPWKLLAIPRAERHKTEEAEADAPDIIPLTGREGDTQISKRYDFAVQELLYALVYAQTRRFPRLNRFRIDYY